MIKLYCKACPVTSLTGSVSGNVSAKSTSSGSASRRIVILSEAKDLPVPAANTRSATFFFKLRQHCLIAVVLAVVLWVPATAQNPPAPSGPGSPANNQSSADQSQDQSVATLKVNVDVVQLFFNVKKTSTCSRMAKPRLSSISKPNPICR